MTAALDSHDHRDPLSPEALLAPTNVAAGGDWMDEVQANSESWGRYELVFDEASGQYELKEYELKDMAPNHSCAATAAPATTAAATGAAPIETAIILDALADDGVIELTSWASLAGPTGPSAFHTPFFWSKALTALADLGAIPALAHSRCGAAWPAVAA